MWSLYNFMAWRIKFLFLIIRKRISGEFLYDIIVKDILVHRSGEEQVKVFDGWIIKRGYFDNLPALEVNHHKNNKGAIANVVVSFELMDEYYKIMAGEMWRENWNEARPYVYDRDNNYSVTYLHIERVSILEALSMPLIKWIRILPSNVVPGSREDK
jgi:hypothetical protein